MTQIPSQKGLYNPTLQALRNLGGSGANQEIYDEVAKILNLSDKQLAVPHGSGTGGLQATKVGYNIAWAINHLKMYGLLENPRRAFWVLTAKGRNTESVDPDKVRRIITRMSREKRERKRRGQKRSTLLSQPEAVDDNLPDAEDVDNDSKWQEELYAVLLEMDPSAFERLFQRVLREDGLYQVDVTGRTGDGGIDGIGIIRIGGFLSFRMLFQCKRYKGPVGAGEVRNFRGAMTGRTDRGLIVTTGHFTQEAKREATRDGVPEIDLIDGEQLIDKLKELSLGVKTKEVVVERVLIDADWFQNI